MLFGKNKKEQEELEALRKYKKDLEHKEEKDQQEEEEEFIEEVEPEEEKENSDDFITDLTTFTRDQIEKGTTLDQISYGLFYMQKEILKTEIEQEKDEVQPKSDK